MRGILQKFRNAKANKARKSNSNSASEVSISTQLAHPLLSGIAVAIVAAFLTLFVTSYFERQQLEAAFALSAVQVRITTCIALSEHHKDYSNETKAGTNVILDDGTLAVSSNNRERHISSINMARALDLCLIEGKSLEGLEACILLRTTDGNGNYDNYVSVIDTKSSHPPQDGGPWPGQRNPSC